MINNYQNLLPQIPKKTTKKTRNSNRIRKAYKQYIARDFISFF